LAEIDAVAACHGPGLAGALLVGVSAAKSLALVTGTPYVGVNHHEAHMYAALLDDRDLAPPLLTLVVSGGHTMLVAMDDHGVYRVLGQTVDDAAGESFDKVARFLGLGYPGGPAIDALALQGDPTAIAFTRPMLDDGLDFSFSGLKTAVVNHVRRHPEVEIADVAASFQAAVVDVLLAKLLLAAERTRISTVVIGGGVAANSALRTRLLDEAEAAGLRAVVPSLSLCTDNAAMIAAAAAYRLRQDGPTPLDAGASPNLRIA
jgi:N6-L-threonylcarbamoyladenine synthase